MFPEDFTNYKGTLNDPESYIVVARPELDATGCKVWTTERLSLGDIASTENGNLTRLDKTGTDIEVPTHTVLAGYVDNQGVPRVADKNGHKSQFLIVGIDHLDFGSYLIATGGVATIPAGGHQYIVGRDYYLGENGVPTTKAEGQKLFTVLDKNRIIVINN